jgi:hypothetical protein
VFRVVRVALPAKVNLGAVWEHGRELVDSVAVPRNRHAHFKLILTEI